MLKYRFICIFLGITFLTVFNFPGCFPDRFPVSPEAYETRRPQVSFVLPQSGDTVLTDTLQALTIWFDEIMDENTVKSNITLSLATADEAWTNLNHIKYADQSQTESNFIVINRDEQGSFYSEDQGNSWIFLRSLAEQKINFLKIDPQNSHIIYAVGDLLIIKSNDRGQNWENINHNLPPDLRMMQLFFDPHDGSKLWLATAGGIYKSSNGGMEWLATGVLPSWSNQEITKILIDPFDSSVIYVATLGRFIYKSIDDGNSWELKRGETNTLGTSRIYDLGIDPDSSRIVYAASVNLGVYKSIDAGNNWIQVNTGIDDLNARIIQIHQVDNQRLYMATGLSVYTSVDRAGTWQKIPQPAGETIRTFFGDSQDAATLYLATANHVFKSTDRGGQWNEISQIAPSSIQIPLTFTFTTWQDSLQFIVFDEENRADTLDIAPYRYNDALAAYDAGLISTPPVDPNPKATKVVLNLQSKLYKNWQYRFLIGGAFDGNVWRGEYGARDVSGMSLQYDFITNFFAR
jgi:photosystem II stability/assembly factor-like uncharacterized protein